MELPRDGVVAVVKHDCPTCQLVEPVLHQLDGLAVLREDEPAALDASYRLEVDTVPTLVRFSGGEEVARIRGWSRDAWEELTGISGLGTDLPDHRPGCGSRTLDPDVAETLLVKHRGGTLHARRIELAELEDEHEALFDRGWSDGLPVVAPTEARVLRMLEGTTRRPDDVVAVVPPNLVEATVEKIAVNAVLAGCRPEYLPVVLAAVEAACTDEFNIHGVLATTWDVGPAVVVNGPIARAIGMNSGGNALGQGNRANATIGRALNLIVRNVGGGLPGGVDRSAHGNPGKYTFCFAEAEDTSPWAPLSVSRGVAPGTSAVTLFAAEGPRGIADQTSREPESLARSMALALRAVGHPEMPRAFDGMLVVGPEHARVFAEAGWSRDRLHRELEEVMAYEPSEIHHDALSGPPPDGRQPKFRPGGLLIVHAGGTAGLFSSVVGGWVGGEMGSEPVTKEVVG